MTPLLLWAQNNRLITIFLLFAIILLLRELFLRTTIKRPIVYYIFLFPGIILHELSHLVFCFLTLAKIRDLKLFSSEGGFVEHENSKIPFLGNFLISIAPLVVGAISIYYLTKELPNGFLEIISSAKTTIVFYFLISILITFFPSKKDVSNSPLLYVITIIILGFALVKFDLSFAFEKFAITSFSAILALSIGILIFLMINRLKWK